jgi:hypothetical protein
MDIELTCCGAPEVFSTLPESVRAGRLDEAFLDRALGHTLPFRFELGQVCMYCPVCWQFVHIIIP